MKKKKSTLGLVFALTIIILLMTIVVKNSAAVNTMVNGNAEIAYYVNDTGIANVEVPNDANAITATDEPVNADAKKIEAKNLLNGEVVNISVMQSSIYNDAAAGEKNWQKILKDADVAEVNTNDAANTSQQSSLNDAEVNTADNDAATAYLNHYSMAQTVTAVVFVTNNTTGRTM